MAPSSGLATHRPLRALAHRAAACRLAGGGAGQLAGRARARRALAGAHRGRRHAALPARHGRRHPAATGRARPACPTRRRSANRSAARPMRRRWQRLLRHGLGLPLRLLAQATSMPRWPRPAQARARHEQAVYPGTCRDGLKGKPARAVRLRTRHGGVGPRIDWRDRRLGAQAQDVEREVGDFVLSAPMACGPTSWRWWWTMPGRASPTWCAAKTWPTTRRGRSCCSARWACPRRAICTRRWCWAPTAHKLSKQNGAQALDLHDPLAALRGAGRVLRAAGHRRRRLRGLAAGRACRPGRRAGWHDAQPSNPQEPFHDHHPFRPAVRRHRRRQRRHRAQRPAGQRALHRLAARPDGRQRPRQEVRQQQGPRRARSASAWAAGRSSAAGTKACRA